MLNEVRSGTPAKPGDITMVLLGGRGAQAMYRRIAELAETTEIDELLPAECFFTQDALAPMRMANGLSFVRDFERPLGPNFFAKIKSFTPMITETDDIERIGCISRKSQFPRRHRSIFLGLGPEAEVASHLCYIKLAAELLDDFVGIIPISETIPEHHIAKFKVGGSAISEADEAECRKRQVKKVLTLGPAAIPGAQSGSCNRSSTPRPHRARYLVSRD
ncbi:MAG: hypothetical protein IPG58_20940 [Acidobacteria bacterium]|nr:hypothetical protein [Acidobacteriota bacterium]